MHTYSFTIMFQIYARERNVFKCAFINDFVIGLVVYKYLYRHDQITYIYFNS